MNIAKFLKAPILMNIKKQILNYMINSPSPLKEKISRFNIVSQQFLRSSNIVMHFK